MVNEQNTDLLIRTGLGETLVTRVSNALRAHLLAGTYKPGDRLPSEAQLVREHGVSRTVVREAIAILRSDGLVKARKGSGVFVLDQSAQPPKPFHDLSPEKVSSVIEVLELRSACEIRSAGLAANRRSAAQIEVIVDAHLAVKRKFEAGESTRDEDFAFHVAIAEATNNSRFPELLRLLRPGMLPRTAFEAGSDKNRPSDYNRHIVEEHGRIVDAIMDSDSARAEQTMREHLEFVLERYTDLMRKSLGG